MPQRIEEVLEAAVEDAEDNEPGLTAEQRQARDRDKAATGPASGAAAQGRAGRAQAQAPCRRSQARQAPLQPRLGRRQGLLTARRARGRASSRVRRRRRSAGRAGMCWEPARALRS